MTPEQLKKARVALTMTQEQFAAVLGFSGGRYVRALESGERTVTARTENHIKLLLKDRKQKDLFENEKLD